MTTVKFYRHLTEFLRGAHYSDRPLLLQPLRLPAGMNASLRPRRRDFKMDDHPHRRLLVISYKYVTITPKTQAARLRCNNDAPATPWTTTIRAPSQRGQHLHKCDKMKNRDCDTDAADRRDLGTPQAEAAQQQLHPTPT